MLRKLFVSVSLLGSLGSQAFFTPYAGEPPMVALTASQQADMAKGKLVYLIDKQDGNVKEGSVAFRVNAKPESVWKVLSDFAQYPEWSYKVGAAKLYKPTQGDTFYVEFTTNALNKHYSVVNRFPMKDWATWATDHSKGNDCVLDTVGYWRVKAVDGNPSQSDVIQYGKIELTNLCANGFFGIGGFDGHEMATQTHANLRSRSEALR